jgi:hypothetical protein
MYKQPRLFSRLIIQEVDTVGSPVCGCRIEVPLPVPIGRNQHPDGNPGGNCSGLGKAAAVAPQDTDLVAAEIGGSQIRISVPVPVDRSQGDGTSVW